MLYLKSIFAIEFIGVNELNVLLNSEKINSEKKNKGNDLNDVESFCLNYINEKYLSDNNAVITEIDCAFAYLCSVGYTANDEFEKSLNEIIFEISEIPLTADYTKYDTKDVVSVAYIMNGCKHEMTAESMQFTSDWVKKKIISELIKSPEYKNTDIFKNKKNEFDFLDEIWLQIKNLVKKQYLIPVYPVGNDYFFVPENMLLVKYPYSNNDEAVNLYFNLAGKFTESNTEKSRIEKLHERYIDKPFDITQTAPISGGISLTEDCQFRCEYCSFSSGGENNKTLSIDDVKGYVDWLVKNVALKKLVSDENNILKILIAGGGEATYKWNLFVDTVKYIKEISAKNNIECSLEITTNGCLSEEQTEFIIDNFSRILVSFDGIEEIQNKNRHFANCEPTYNIVSRTLKKLDEKEANYSIITVVQLDDITRIEEIASSIFSQYPNLRELSIRPAMPTGRAANYSNEYCKYDFASSYFLTEQKLGNPLKMSCSLFNYKWSRGIFCGALYGQHPWLTPNGNIVTCQDAREESVVVGHVVNGEVKAVQNIDTYADIAFSQIESCRLCDMFWFCHGNCPLNPNDDERKYYQSCVCVEMKKYWYLLLNKLIKNGSHGKWHLEKISGDIPCNAKVWRIKSL